MRNIRKKFSETSAWSVTSQRKLLIDLIFKSTGHISAKELYRRAIRKNDSISLATVYRNLRLFSDLGLIEELRFGKERCHYEVKRPRGHHHLVCRGCGKVIEFEDPLIAKLSDMMDKDYGFWVTKTDLFMEGYCEKCRVNGHEIKKREQISSDEFKQLMDIKKS